MSRAGTILWVLLCCAVPAAQASAGATAPTAVRPLDLTDLEAPAFTNFGQDEGLPDAGVSSTCVDREGFVWGATPAGVYRYDGRRWAAVEDPALRHSATHVFVDHAGRVWAAFRNTGLAVYDGTRWQAASTETGLPSNQIKHFAETTDASGQATLWALTWDRGLMRLRNGRWELDPGNASLPADPLRSMAQTRQLGAPGRQWLGTNARGLWYRDAGQVAWRRWEGHQFDVAQVEDLMPIMQHGREELWIATYTGGLWRLRDDGLRHWSHERDGLPSNVIYNVANTALPDGNRAIWVATRAGLVRLHEDTLQVFNRRQGLRSDVIRDVMAWRSPDGLDVLWMASDWGVTRTVLGASPWVIASLMGSDALGVFGFLVEPDGQGGERLWVSSSGEGLSLYQGRQWHHFGQDEGVPPDANIGSVIATRDEAGRSTHWVSLRGGVVLRRRPGQSRFAPMATPWKHTEGELLYDTLVRTYEGRREQWFATRETGLYRLRDGAWTHFPPPVSNAPWRALRVLEVVDGLGRSWLWAATNHGLARFDGTRWDTLGADLGLADRNIIGLSLIPDASGRQVLWLGTASAGAARVDVSDPRTPRSLGEPLPPPPDPSVYNAQVDSRGRVYLCTNNGVQLLTPNAHGFDSRIFGRHDGLLHQECNYVQYLDPHDRFWTGTLGGLAVYDPKRELHDTQPKPLRVTGLKIDGRDVAGPSLQVPPGKREIRVDYALLSWFRESDSRFRTQLLGYDAMPGAWTEQNFRSFNALPPGHYRLRVEARDHAGNASLPVEVPITIQAAWWQTRGARIAAVMAVLLAGYGLAAWRTRRLREQRRALEQRVRERTAELHEANERLRALSYRDELTGLDNRRRLLEVVSPAQEPLPRALILLDVDHFKRFNDRFGHLAGDEALRQVASAMRSCAGAQATVARHGGEEFACVLPTTDARHALDVAECIRGAVAACELHVPGQDAPWHITISAGVAVATIRTHEDTLRLFNDADLALYQAKDQGRDQVQLHRPP